MYIGQAKGKQMLELLAKPSIGAALVVGGDPFVARIFLQRHLAL